MDLLADLAVLSDDLAGCQPVGVPTRGESRKAIIVCIVTAMATLLLLPVADKQTGALPGFFLLHESALILAYALSTWAVVNQARRGRSTQLMIIAGGNLYTTLIVMAQLLSVPGALASSRIIGEGSASTVWLWTFWHLGPPVCALGFAWMRRPDEPNSANTGSHAVWFTIAAAVGAAIACTGLATCAHVLPSQVAGDDYAAMIRSGVGPAVELLTLVALAATLWRTRDRRTTLEVWIAAALALLVLDNLLTMAGGARGSVGWVAGRVEALVSALAILWAYLSDIDALRQRAEAAAEELRHTGDALREAQKMEAVGRLTGGVAHDFNNLLTVITSGLETIRRDPNNQERVVRVADTGLAAAQRGARLTRQLLSFSSRQVLRPTTLNLNALLVEFEPLANRAVGEAAALSLNLDPALYPVYIDRDEFEAAVLNLLVNARDATAGGHARIGIATRNARPAHRMPRHRRDSMAPGDYAVVSVTDDGCGMDDATLAQAFEPFFTTKVFGKGSGLGLSQVYGFARGAGGSIDVNSSPGAGTTIELWLPRTAVPADAAPLRPAARAAQPRVRPGETVLAVDDEPEVLTAVVENLTDLGYRVVQACDADQAVARLRDDPAVDILFSDIVMPGGMDGVQLAEEARVLHPGLRVVLTSGYSHETMRSRHHVPNYVQFLAKPYRRAELAARLEASRRNLAEPV